MTRSNTANGGTSYFDLEIQVVTITDAVYILRAVVYVTSLNVTDTVNNLAVTGNWSGSGAIALGGAYTSVPVWYQDVSFNRGTTSQTVTVNAAWSAVDYWGTTLSASNSYVIPPAPNPVSPPAAPPVSHDQVTQVGARFVVGYPPNDGGAAIDAYGIYVLSNNAWPDAGGNIVTSSPGTFTTTVLMPMTLYYYTARAHNPAGWSAWAAMRTVTTNPNGSARAAGTWHNQVGYARVGGVWRPMQQGYTKVGGAWRSW